MSLKNLTLSQKGLILLVVTLVLELVFVSALGWMLYKTEAQVEEEAHTRTVISQLNRLSNLTQRSTIELIRFVITLNRNPTPQLISINKEIHQDLQQLKDLVRSNPTEFAKIEQLEQYTLYGISLMGDARASYFQDRELHLQISRKLHQLSDNCSRLSDEILDDYKRLEESSTKAQEQDRFVLKMWVGIGLILNVILAFVAGWFFTRGITKRLNILVDNSFRLASSKPLNPLMAGNDELANVDLVFHKMAAALEDAAKKERAVIENAVDVIFSIAADDKFINVSPASLKLWGYGNDELIGIRYFEIVASADRALTRDALKEIMSGKLDAPFENKIVRKDGAEVEVLWSAHWNKEEKTFFCVAHDITERKRAETMLKESEERVRSVLEHLPVGVLTIESSGKIDSCNPRIEEIFGYKEDELLGKEIRILLPSLSSGAESLTAQLTAMTAGKALELQGKRQGGDAFPAELSVNKYQSRQGERLLVNIQDITERHEIERMKQEFVAMVSHDLRTPLSAVQGTLTLIAEGVYSSETEAGQKRVRAAQESIERLINLINDLLDIEKLEAGMLSMSLHEIELSGVVEKSIEAVRGVAEQNSIEIKTHPHKVKILADRDRLVQVLVNLLSNAIKFSPAKSTVEITSEAIDDFAEIKVIDRGRGIPEKHKGAIFERFKQVEESDGKRRQGTGLGLAICKAIVESHSGIIGVTSTEGAGSTFWLRIPLASQQSADRQEKLETAKKNSNAP